MKKRLNIILGWNVIQNEITQPLELLERTSIFYPNLPLRMMKYAGNLYEKFIVTVPVLFDAYIHFIFFT